MAATYISFYLKAYRIHGFVDSLRGIGNPKRICFMLSDDGNRLLLVPYYKRDLKSHNVPDKANSGGGGVEISSYNLCGIISTRHKWDPARSYRVPGVVYPDKRIAAFDLTKAEPIVSSNR